MAHFFLTLSNTVRMSTLGASLGAVRFTTTTHVSATPAIPQGVALTVVGPGDAAAPPSGVTRSGWRVGATSGEIALASFAFVTLMLALVGFCVHRTLA